MRVAEMLGEGGMGRAYKVVDESQAAAVVNNSKALNEINYKMKKKEENTAQTMGWSGYAQRYDQDAEFQLFMEAKRPPRDIVF